MKQRMLEAEQAAEYLRDALGMCERERQQLREQVQKQEAAIAENAKVIELQEKLDKLMGEHKDLEDSSVEVIAQLVREKEGLEQALRGGGDHVLPDSAIRYPQEPEAYHSQSAVSTRSDEAPGDTPEGELERTRRQLQGLQQEIQRERASWEAGMQNLRLDVEAHVRHRQDLQDIIEHLKREKDGVPEVLATLREEKFAAQREVERLRGELHQERERAKEGPKDDERLREAEEKAERLRDELRVAMEMLHSKGGQQQGRIDEVTSSEERDIQVSELQREVERLRDLLREQLEASEKELRVAEVEIERLRDALREQLEAAEAKKGHQWDLEQVINDMDQVARTTVRESVFHMVCPHAH